MIPFIHMLTGWSFMKSKMIWCSRIVSGLSRFCSSLVILLRFVSFFLTLLSSTLFTCWMLFWLRWNCIFWSLFSPLMGFRWSSTKPLVPRSLLHTGRATCLYIIQEQFKRVSFSWWLSWAFWTLSSRQDYVSLLLLANPVPQNLTTSHCQNTHPPWAIVLSCWWI